MDHILSIIRSRHAVFAFGILCLVALVASACGGDDEAAASTDGSVATLADPGDDASGSDEAVDAELAADEAALEFSQCMREQGLDFPDVGVDAEGNPDLRSSFIESGVTPDSEEFQTGLEACGSILQNAGFGGGRGNLAEDPAVQDGLVEYSQCLRDEGLAVGDIQLGGGGGQGATPPQDGQGQGGGGIDREARIAAFLGIDPDDPEVASALETCGPILDQLFAQEAGDTTG